MTFITSPINGIKSVGNSSTNTIGGSNSLNGGINNSETTINLINSSMFPLSGSAKIESEYITFTGNTGTSLTGCTRGAFNSTPVSHTTGVAIIGIFVGTSEMNTQPDVMVSIKSDTNGLEYLDFSTDNVLWDTFPVKGFNVTANIHEFHTAVKGSRYFRIRFENGSALATTAFRVNTYYGFFQQGNLPLNQSISADSDSRIVRAINVGEEPNGSFTNQKTDGIGFSTVSLLSNGETFSSGILDLNGYTQVQTQILSDKNGTIDISFSPDSDGIDIVSSLQIPYIGGSGLKFFSAPAFTSYVKYEFTCNEAGQTDFYFDTKFTTKSISGQILGMSDFISPGMVANLGRNVLVGQTPVGSFENQRIDGVAFRTETPLGIGGIYTSPLTSVDGYSQIETHLFSDTAGSLTGRWYNDSNKTTLLRTFTRPYSGIEVGSISYFSSPIFGPYLEYEYTNGGIGQTTFFMDFHNRIKAISGQVLGMNDFIPSGVVANLGRNVLVGQDAQSSFKNVGVDYDGDLRITIANPVSAFGDLRVTELTPQVQLQFPYNINSDIVNSVVLNGGTVTQADSMSVLSSSTATNGSAIMESIRQIKYRSGLGALARFTTLYTTGVAGAKQIAGVGDEEDGFFFGFNGTEFGIMKRQNSVDDWIPQSTWSTDKLDGNGRSKMVLDHTKLNVYSIEYQWLGAGEVLFKIEDFTTGKFNTVHRIKYANTSIIPSVNNPSFPLHMSIIKTSGSTDVIMKAASMAGFVEGKSIITGPINTFSGTSSHSVETAIFHIQNVSTYISKKNRVSVFLRAFGAANDVNQLATFRIRLNATLAGTPAWINVNGLNSVIQSDIVQTFSSGGKVIFSATVGKDSGETYEFDVDKYAIRPGDVLTITSTSGSVGAMGASLIWQEDF